VQRIQTHSRVNRLSLVLRLGRCESPLALPPRVLILASCLVQLPQEDAIDGTGAGAFSGSQKRVKVVTIGDVRHELAFAIASRTSSHASSNELC
jgi:hypothetical protein